MKKSLFVLLTLCLAWISVHAQVNFPDDNFNQMDASGNMTTGSQRHAHGDSTNHDKEIPIGIKVWTVDSRFGDRTPAIPDTVSHMYMNTIFTSGVHGDYITTGNLGDPRLNRIFVDRKTIDRQFLFINPFSYFIVPPQDYLFTNTLSPYTNLSYNNCGNRVNGEDHFTAKFGVNASKRLGLGFKFDYLYGRGYYTSQATSLFDFTLYGSYIGDRYQSHLIFSTNHQKMAENGGIIDENYITHPEIFSESYEPSEIPTVFALNWNRNNNHHVFFTQRYNIGYNRKVPMTADEIKAKKFALASQKENADKKKKQEAVRKAKAAGRDIDPENIKTNTTFAGRPDNAKIVDKVAPQDTTATGGTTTNTRIKVGSKAQADSLLAADKKAAQDTAWLKNEYVPVTSFIHTLDFNQYRRIYEAYTTPENYYLDHYTVQEKLRTDSIYDKTTYWSLRNTFAISMLEGFNKWAKAGLKAFITDDLRHFVLPNETGVSTWTESALSVGGELSKRQGKTFHYHALAEFGILGINLGELHVDGGLDLNFPLFKDTVSFTASGFYHREKPAFYYRHYQSRHYWWDDNSLAMTDHFRAMGTLSYSKTHTRLMMAYDMIHNYTYFSTEFEIANNTRMHNAVRVLQNSTPVSLLTAQLAQDFKLGPIHWDNVITLQKSSNDDVLPLPLLNAYSNLYLRFKIARVLKCDLGGDVRYFTTYKAPAYVPGIGQYAVQGNKDKIDVGNYPIVNVYANFHIKQTRFFVMMSHVNAGMGKKNYFLTPFYPLNGSVLRFGLSWNFFN